MRKRHNVKAHIAGNVWKITTVIGAEVCEVDTVVIMDSMKMEMPVESEISGRVVEIPAKEGTPAQEGQILVILEE